MAGGAASVAFVSADIRSIGPMTLVLETLCEAPSEPDFVADAPLVAFDAFIRLKMIVPAH
jgi:hypothetical protein